MYTSAEIAVNYVANVKIKVKRPGYQILIQAILAGMFIAFAGVATNAAMSTIENPSSAKLIAALIFPAGLFMVIIFGAELFTGNMLLSYAHLEGEITFFCMLKNWAIIFVGNFIGAALIAWIITAGHGLGMFSNAVAVTTIKVAIAKCGVSFFDGVLLGILCNIIVCAGIWVGMAGKTIADKILSVYLVIVVFVLTGAEHCVANMYYILAGAFASGNEAYAAAALAHGIDAGAVAWGSGLVQNLIPVTLGNIIGGAYVLVPLLWFLYGKRRTKVQG